MDRAETRFGLRSIVVRGRDILLNGRPVFLRGAYIVYAHSVLQRQSGLGYLSPWAKKMFPTVSAKNEFFEKLGRELKPGKEGGLRGLTADATPLRVMARLH
jgi:hypothetical protein